MSAGIYNFTWEQGATVSQTMYWKVGDPAFPVDLTGFTARMSLKSQGTQALSLTTANSRIVLGGVEGSIVLSVDAVTTATLLAGSYAYDLELVSSDATPVVTRLLKGFVNISGNITT
jgi:hypothetical protein